jgi:ankyrin repeat protein
MSLPLDEAGMRELEQKCESQEAVASKRTVTRLQAQTPGFREAFMIMCSILGLANLARCAIEARVSPDTRESTGKHSPVLVRAAGEGHARIVKLLLENGADHALLDDAGCTALLRAAQLGHEDCVRLLIDAHADALKAEHTLGNTPLMMAVIDKHPECARLLIPESELGQYSKEGTTAFHDSVTTASKECFELLLPLVDVDVRTVAGMEADGSPSIVPLSRTALHIACAAGLFEFVKALLRAGASSLAKDSQSFTPLHAASQFGHLACVTHLLGRPDNPKMTPAEVDTVNVQGCTSLHMAAFKGHERVCGALLEAGASLSATIPPVITPLMLAQQQHPTKASLLALLSGAGPEHPPGTVCDRCGKTAEQAGIRCLKVCGFCQNARYCCEACAAADWRAHKRACREHVAEREERTRARVV